MEHDRTTGTVGGSFDSWRARAGSLGTPDLFAEHQRKLVRCSGCCETAGAGWKSWHQNKSFRGDRTIERGNIACGINRRGPRLRRTEITEVTYAMPVAAGKRARSSENDSSPPTEAPMQTIGRQEDMACLLSLLRITRSTAKLRPEEMEGWVGKRSPSTDNDIDLQS
jgi:hypothetical protein